MVEPVGFTGIILGLPGLFTSAVECFKYVQLGRNFGADCGKCLLQLETARQRLDNWGVAVGIMGEHASDFFGMLDENQTLLVQSLLEEILDTFATAETASANFVKRCRITDPDGASQELQVLDPAQDLGKYQNLYKTMKASAEKRQKKSNFMEKTKWALYKKEKFDGMIADVRGFVSDLVDLFPPGPKREEFAQKEKALAKEDIEQITVREDLLLFKDVIGDSDPTAKEIVDEMLQSHQGGGHNLTDVKLAGSFQAFIRDENDAGRPSHGHTVSKVDGKDNAILRIGNVNR